MTTSYIILGLIIWSFTIFGVYCFARLAAYYIYQRAKRNLRQDRKNKKESIIAQQNSVGQEESRRTFTDHVARRQNSTRKDVTER